MIRTATLPSLNGMRFWLVLGLLAAAGLYAADRAEHPSVVMMKVNGQLVESRVIAYGAACHASASTMSVLPEPSPVRDFSR